MNTENRNVFAFLMLGGGMTARGGRPADGARIQPERPLGMKKNVFPIFFLNDELPVNLSLILRLVVTAMKRNTRSEFYRA